MPSLQERLLTVLGEVLPVEEEPDGALTVRHAGTIASLRVVTITEDLDLVSLTQILAWDLVLTKKIRDKVAEQAHSTQLGSVALVEKAGETPAKRNSGKTGRRDAALQLSGRWPERRRAAHADPDGARQGRRDPQHANGVTPADEMPR